MSDYDLVIRGGQLADGTGADLRSADAAINSDKIVEVGTVAGTGRTEIDASGLLVTPGFVDLHTHYDGQAIWSNRLIPSSSHGVTTVVVGNCGVGFAPCRPEDQDELVTLMEGVEDIPGVVLRDGLSWEWETFPQFLNELERRQWDVDVATLFPHSPLRVYVMGERALRREEATEEDLVEMQRLVSEAIDVGALGFATSRTHVHRNSKGDLIPSFETQEPELTAIGEALRRTGRGVIQVVPNVMKAEVMRQEMITLIGLARSSTRPVMISLVQFHDDPESWREYISMIDEANVEQHLPVSVQVFPRANGIILGHSVSKNPFVFCPSYDALAQLPIEERVRELRRPEVRARLLTEAPADPGYPLFKMMREFDRIYVLGTHPNYEPQPSDSIAAIAKARGVPALELAYDVMIEDDGQALLYLTVANYAASNLDAAREMMMNEHSIFGLGDGGAHYGLVCDAGFPTFLLTHWTRDRASDRLPLTWTIKALSQDTARAVGLNDRGILAPGYKADVNVIDYEGMQVHRPHVVQDLPGGGRRLVEDSEGYVATIVSGKIVYQNAVATGALPGRLIRGSQEIH